MSVAALVFSEQTYLTRSALHVLSSSKTSRAGPLHIAASGEKAALSSVSLPQSKSFKILSRKYIILHAKPSKICVSRRTGDRFVKEAANYLKITFRHSKTAGTCDAKLGESEEAFKMAEHTPAASAPAPPRFMIVSDLDNTMVRECGMRDGNSRWITHFNVDDFICEHFIQAICEEVDSDLVSRLHL